MKTLRAADRLATPWKNGLGVTREIAVYPPGAGLDDFDWRVSMASVDAGGPFSIFPGVDRVLAVLEGRLALRIDGAAPIELDPDAPPQAFAGDVLVEADLLAGPVTDLNVMIRRGLARPRLERIWIDAPIEIGVSATTIVLVRTDDVDLVVAGRREGLGVDDAVLFDGGDIADIRLAPRKSAMVLIVRFTKPSSC